MAQPQAQEGHFGQIRKAPKHHIISPNRLGTECGVVRAPSIVLRMLYLQSRYLPNNRGKDDLETLTFPKAIVLTAAFELPIFHQSVIETWVQLTMKRSGAFHSEKKC